MKTPDPHGYSRASAIARLDLTKQKNEPSHWSFTNKKRTHKSLPTNGRLDRAIYNGAVELDMTYTIKCMANPLKGDLRSDTIRAKRCAILNSL